jgi:NADPH:quinone reductase-like Zn-dependent oxidoreductase
MSSLPTTMKAVLIERFGGPELLTYCDVPTPQPGPRDVVVEVRAATVNLTLDIHTRQDGDGRNPMLPLVLGSDPVGVIAAAGSDAGVQSALELGADAGINYRRQDLEAEVMAAADGRGVDVAFENSGDSKLWASAFACLARNGTMVTAGAHGGEEVTVNIKRLYRLKLRILGGTANTDEDFVATCDGAAQKQLRIPIHCILPLSRVAEAHELVSSRAAVGKVVLVPDRAA